MLTEFGQKVGGWISDHLLGWLPDSVQEKIRAWFEGADWGKWIKNLFLGAIVLGVLSKFGFLKLLTPMAALLAKIPVLGPLIAKIGGLAAGIGRAVAGALGLGKLFPKAAGGGVKMHDPKAMQASVKAQAAASKGGGGMFGKLKGGLNKLSPKSMMAAAKSAGPMGILKGVAKKAVPGLSSALLMYQGVKGAIDVFKSNQEAGAGFWKSLGKAGAVAGTATVGAGLSFVPGMGLIAPIAGGIATSKMRDAMMGAPPGEQGGGDININLNVDGELARQDSIDRNNNVTSRELSSQEGANMSIYG